MDVGFSLDGRGGNPHLDMCSFDSFHAVRRGAGDNFDLDLHITVRIDGEEAVVDGHVTL